MYRVLRECLPPRSVAVPRHPGTARATLRRAHFTLITLPHTSQNVTLHGTNTAKLDAADTRTWTATNTVQPGFQALRATLPGWKPGLNWPIRDTCDTTDNADSQKSAFRPASLRGPQEPRRLWQQERYGDKSPRRGPRRRGQEATRSATRASSAPCPRWQLIALPLLER